jgi:hypothetical protein
MATVPAENVFEALSVVSEKAARVAPTTVNPTTRKAATGARTRIRSSHPGERRSPEFHPWVVMAEDPSSCDLEKVIGRSHGHVKGFSEREDLVRVAAGG